LSDTPEEIEKKKASEASKKQSEQSPSSQPAEEQQQQQPKPVVSRPVIGTPVGKPTVGTPVSRPTIGSPVGKPIASAPPKPTAAATTSAPPARPTVGRPTVGSPVSSTATATRRPTIGSGTPVVAGGAPSVPKKKVEESKEEVSRRKFLRGLAVLGGIVAIAQFGLLGPYLQGTVKGTQASGSSQAIRDSKGNTMKASDVSLNGWKTFVWPYTGNPNLDNDTFSQFVVIHLPHSLSASSPLGAKDPSSGDTFVALSRVCVHLWCLWSYVPADQRAECPCHGSQYVPGMGPPYDKPPGTAVLGPASLQTPPNNQLPMLELTIAKEGTISTTGTLVGQIGCGQLC
jgi:rieske iron-sulfur protein